MSTDKTTQAANPPAHTHNKQIFVAAGLALVIVIVLLIVGILPRLKRNTALAQGVKQAKSNVPEVVVAKPKWVADNTINLPGNIEAIKETTIGSRSTGYLTKLYVDIGSKVKAGQVVAEVTAKDVNAQERQAAAQAEQSGAVVKQSQADVSRQKDTVAQDKADVDKARATLEQTEAQLTSAKATVVQNQAGVEQAESALNAARNTLKVQEAALQQQKATLDLAQKTYDRNNELVQQGYAAKQDADQALATLNTNKATIVSAEAAITVAQTNITTAEKAIDAQKALVASAQANVAAAAKNVKANAAALKSAEATLRFQQETVRYTSIGVAANQAGLKSNLENQRRYQVLTGYQKILAPFDGVITARNVDVGALLVADNNSSSSGTAAASALSSNSSTTGGSGILGIARTDQVRIQVSVPQSFVPSLRAGSNAKVTVRELSGKEFTGTVTLRAGALDTVSRTQLIEVHLANPTGILVPGMYANVEISPLNPPRTIRIPGTALIVDSNGTRVGIVSADKKVHMQNVVIGRDFGTTVEILSGLKGNEKLVNNPSDLLQDGDKVQIAPPVKGRGGKGAKGAPADGSDGSSGSSGNTMGKSKGKGGRAPAGGE